MRYRSMILGAGLLSLGRLAGAGTAGLMDGIGGELVVRATVRTEGRKSHEAINLRRSRPRWVPSDPHVHP
jgi:hypothetical protein